MESIPVIDLFVEHELALGRLYAVYSDKYFDDSSFWKTLSEEEISHAAQIRALKSKVDNNRLSVDTSRFRSELLRTSIAYVNKQAAVAEADNSIPPITALTTARDLEKSMIERKFFELFSGDPAELKPVLDAMTVETKAHVERLDKKWQEKRTSF